MFCKNCGQELDDSSKFCPTCGTDNTNTVDVIDNNPVEKNEQTLNKDDEVVPTKNSAFICAFLSVFLGPILALIAIVLAKNPQQKSRDIAKKLGYFVIFGWILVFSALKGRW